MPVEYERQYRNLTKHYSRYHGYAYDGVWAAALAIEDVGHQAHAHNLSLSDFSYRWGDYNNMYVGLAELAMPNTYSTFTVYEK